MVTGGRPWMYMRATSEMVWTVATRTMVQNAARFSVMGAMTQERQAMTATSQRRDDGDCRGRSEQLS